MDTRATEATGGSCFTEAVGHPDTTSADSPIGRAADGAAAGAADKIDAAAACLRQVKEAGGSLLVLSGAG